MGLFPQYSNVYKNVQTTIKQRAGNNLAVSGLKPWIRLSSGADKGLVLASNLNNDTFENRYGSTNTSGRIGNDFSGTPVFAKSKAFARSLRPSPVIESINIKNGSEGLSRKLTFQIKCFSLPQLDVVLKHFLEPRYYLLAEWGWNTALAYNQMAKVQGVGMQAAICDIISYQNLGVLKKKRDNSHGHYDAFLGVITGGGVSYGDSETYLVDVEVTTQGEIPAYLQSHKGAVKNIDTTDGGGNDSSKVFDIEKDIEFAENAGQFGKALFMYMYNDLPASKRIQKIMNWRDNLDDEGNDWTQEYHYINMNKTIKDELLKDLSESSAVNFQGQDGQQIKGETGSDQPLISEQRFISMELAWKILHTTDADLRIREINCSNEGATTGLDNVISIDDTVIRAHKHMFSIDKDYLYIPNANGPDFGLMKALTSTTEISGSNGFFEIKDGQIQTQNFEPNGLPEERKFPQPVATTITAHHVYDDSFKPVKEDAYKWGYLKHIYINFDFFIQCMDRNGYLVKDVALEILNGLSGACNLFWDFQIAEAGSTKSKNSGQTGMRVVDKSFTGKPPSDREGLLSLQTIGTTSPFLEFGMKLEVAGAMANQVMAQRNSVSSPSETSDVNIESKPESYYNLFANRPDGVGTLLHTIKTKNDEEARLQSEQIANSNQTQAEKEIAEYERKKAAGENITFTDGVNQIVNVFEEEGLWAAITSTVEVVVDVVKDEVLDVVDVVTSSVGLGTFESRKARQSNYELFLQNAGVFPKVNDPKKADFSNGFWDWNQGNNVSITDSTMVCAVWKDSQLLRQVYEHDLNPNKSWAELQKELLKTPGYLPVEVNFTLHGISGFKVGDMMHFQDLPHIYRRKLFTVFEVEQTINDDIWQTAVVAKLRNIDLISPLQGD